MKIAVAQINTTVGDIAGNQAAILDAYRRGVAAGVDVVICPEMAVTGYPPRDLLLRSSFVEANLAAVDQLALSTGPVALLTGFVARSGKRPGRALRNSAALLQNGRVLAVRHKTLLPTYDVFDEDRYFEPAEENLPVLLNGSLLGITICEDVWNDADFWPDRRYRPDPPAVLAAAGAEVLVNLSASPWNLGKERTRHDLLAALARKIARPVVYANLVGGNDELIFDGQSVAFDGLGGMLAQGEAFAEDFQIVDTTLPRRPPPASQAPPACEEEQLYRALVLGTRDYLFKCGFKSAVLGLSGGIDSALVACLAVAALGPANVRGLSLPSEFSSQGSLDDAVALARNLGIRHDVVPIQQAFVALKEQLRGVFGGRPEDVTEENIQARLRGTILMAMSNKFGSLLLTTGNKSELAVGYCTLYGDMCGGLAVISDVPKTAVYRLAGWINAESRARAGRPLIPDNSISKPPSAELRPNQTDQDSLPPYETLDAILEDYVVHHLSPAEIIASGRSEDDVRRVIRLIDLAEYKRRQAAPGLKVTSKAFGVGRRVPVAQHWREI